MSLPTRTSCKKCAGVLMRWVIHQWRDGQFVSTWKRVNYSRRFNDLHDVSGLLVYTQEEMKHQRERRYHSTDASAAFARVAYPP